MREWSMSDENTKNPLDFRKKQIGLWTGGIFIVLSLAFFGYSTYIVFIAQKGRFDLSDKLLMPVTVMMVLASILSLTLIWRDRMGLGAGLLFFMVNLLPPFLAVLILKNVALVAILFVVVLAIFLIGWVFPTPSRRWGIIAAGVTIILIVGIELWNPSFRSGNSLTNYTVAVIVLAGLGLVVFFLRQAWIGNITTKLVAALLVISIISVGVVVFTAQQTLSASLTTNIGSNLADLAKARSSEIALAVDRELYALKTLAQNQAIENFAHAATDGPQLSQAEIDRLDQQWRAADKANNNADPLVARILNNEISDQLRKYRDQFPQQVEIFLTDVQGVSIATTNRTSDYLQADEEWWQIAYRDDQYIGQPEYDDSSKTIAINMALTVRESGYGRIVGVLRTTVNFTTLTDTLISGLFGKTGRTIILLPSGMDLRLKTTEGGAVELVEDDAPPEIQTLANSSRKYMQISLGGVPTLASKANMKISGSSGPEKAAITGLNWLVVTLQDRSDALQPVNTQTRNLVIITAAILLLVTLAAFGLARLISGPVVRLNAVARQVASGDLTVQAKVETRDEVGALAKTFNEMVVQLHQTLTGLEQRVADRTRAIETSSEISRRLSTILDQKQLALTVVEEVQRAFNFYHAHIYLYDEAEENLVMVGGTGEAGQLMLSRKHQIPKGRGLVGRAAEQNQVVLVSDTQADPTWLPNPLLPETKTEAAVPISVGGRVSGVLDVQHNVVNGLDQQDVDLLQAIANQVAVAVQNASLFTQTQHQADREGLVNAIGQKIQTASTVEGVLQVLARELGAALKVQRVMVQVGGSPTDDVVGKG
jgi:putative methionine-R-sulfoxide reductase with GAF domain